MTMSASVVVLPAAACLIRSAWAVRDDFRASRHVLHTARRRIPRMRRAGDHFGVNRSHFARRSTLHLIALVLLCAGCASHDEVSRVPSPDRHLDAVLVESNTGATTSFWYDVYVVKDGSSTRWGTFGSVRL